MDRVIAEVILTERTVCPHYRTYLSQKCYGLMVNAI